jgi:hypothetical protein
MRTNARTEEAPTQAEADTTTASVPTLAMWQYVENQHEKTFYEDWTKAAAISNSIDCMEMYTTLSSPHTGEQLWHGALNSISSMYYTSAGWDTTTSFELPQAWRNESTTAMLEQALRTAYPRYTTMTTDPDGEDTQDTQTQPVNYHIHQEPKYRDGPGESRYTPTAGMLSPKSGKKFPSDIMDKNISMLTSGTAPLWSPDHGTNQNTPSTTPLGTAKRPRAHSQADLEEHQIRLPDVITEKNQNYR